MVPLTDITICIEGAPGRLTRTSSSCILQCPDISLRHESQIKLQLSTYLGTSFFLGGRCRRVLVRTCPHSLVENITTSAHWLSTIPS